MKALIFTLFSIGFVTVRAQIPLTGFCVDSLGNPVEYVTVGVPDSFYGTITDVNGRFNLLIPDSLKERSLTFSHISYQTLTQPIGSLRQKQVQSGGQLEVVLIDHSFPIREVVFSGDRRRLRIKSLNGAGVRIPTPWPASFSIPSGIQDPEDAKRAEDAGVASGVLLDLKKETWIRRIHFDILRNSFDTLTFRVVVYQKDESRYVPLMSSPCYFDIEKSDVKSAYEIDLSEYGIVAQGTVYVGMESVEIGSKGYVHFPLFLNSNSYWIDLSTNEVRQSPYSMGIGFQVKGSTIE